MNVIILGSRSDIYQQMRQMMLTDGWALWEWHKGDLWEAPKWDLVINYIGKVAPVGPWVERDIEMGVRSNLLRPISLLQELWNRRKPNASVCFFAGSNPNKVMHNYVPYATGKMALLKAVEHMDAESPDVKMFALAPGYVQTKIHKPTLEAGIPNERIARGGGTPIQKIYDCLKWCIQQPKEVVGGRNICVSDPWGAELAEKMKADPNLYKLRRVE